MFIRTVIGIIKDMGSFMLILIVIVFGFAHVFYRLQQPPVHLSNTTTPTLAQWENQIEPVWGSLQQAIHTQILAMMGGFDAVDVSLFEMQSQEKIVLLDIFWLFFM